MYQQLIGAVRGQLKLGIECVQLIQKCVASCKAKELNAAQGMEAIKKIVDLQKNLSLIAEHQCRNSMNKDVRQVGNYISVTFKQSVLKLGESIRIMLKTQDPSLCEKCVPEFIAQTKAVLTMMKKLEDEGKANPTQNVPTLNRNQTQVNPPTNAGRGNIDPKRAGLSRSTTNDGVTKNPSNNPTNSPNNMAGRGTQQQPVPQRATLIKQNTYAAGTNNTQKPNVQPQPGRGNEMAQRQNTQGRGNPSPVQSPSLVNRVPQAKPVAQVPKNLLGLGGETEPSRVRYRFSRASNPNEKKAESAVKNLEAELLPRPSKARASKAKYRFSSAPESNALEQKIAKMAVREEDEDEEFGDIDSLEKGLDNEEKKKEKQETKPEAKPQNRLDIIKQLASLPEPEPHEVFVDVTEDLPEDDVPISRERFGVSDFMGCFTDPGERYGDTNQDTFLFAPCGENGYVFGVFDGHGINGEIASEIARDTFQSFFEENDIFATENRSKQHEMIKKVFKIAHKNILSIYEDERLQQVVYQGVNFHLIEYNGLKMYRSTKKKHGILLQDFGTTAVVAFVKTFDSGAVDIIIANAGDSAAIIGREDKSGVLLPIDDLCEIHNAQNEGEVKRLEATGATIADDDYIVPPEESGFEWAQLAVARSLGHQYFAKYGIIADPYISNYSLNNADKYLVLSSDGVTDVLSSKDILNAITFFEGPCNGNMQKITTRLVKHSLSVWDEDEDADNTTAIVINLKKIQMVD